jgi:CTP synthase (UTP-ammonia lyase)
MRTATVGILGDFDGRVAHIATNEAIRHSAEALSAQVGIQWVATPDLLIPGAEFELRHFDALLASPGSPYCSLEGMLRGIRVAREHNIPFTGT